MTLLVDAQGAADALKISRAHLYGMHNSGRLGPMPIHLGRSARWSFAELMNWVQQGCPSRQIWVEINKTDEITRPKLQAG